MKRLNLTPALIIFLSLLFFTSCEKEKPLSELIIGKWECEYVTRVVYENNELAAEIKQYLKTDDVALELVQSGTGIYTQSGDDFLFSWSLNGNSLAIIGLSQETIVWNVEMNGDKLVWSYDETDPEDTTLSYKYLFTAKRVN